MVLGSFYILFHFTYVQLSVQCRIHLNAEIDALALQYCNIVFVISHFALFCFPLLSNDVLIGESNNPILSVFFKDSKNSIDCTLEVFFDKP